LLILLTPSDHSAQNPRLDGYEVPQLIYTTTDRVWYHVSASKLKTFITLPATLTQFMRLVQAPIEISPTVPTNAPSSSSSSSALEFAAEASGPSSTPSPWSGMKLFPSNTHEMIPVVEAPASISAFPGLWPYNNVLPPPHSFVFDESHILIVSGWRSQNVILLCSDEDDSLSRLPLPLGCHPASSMSLHDVDRATGRLIVGVSHMCQSEALYVAELRFLSQGEVVQIGQDFLPVPLVHKDGSAVGAFSSAADEDEDEEDVGDSAAQVKYTPLLASAEPLNAEAARRLSACSFEILQVPVAEGEKYADGTKQLPFEAVLLTPAIVPGQPLPPLFVFPHGGPHGVSSTAFSSMVAFYACAGASVMYVNYRGSTAFGQAALATLPGKCGRQDVDDCMAALELVLSRTGSNAVADRNNVHVQGGSHGGFLTTHLIGQFPSTFQTAVARNPVTNIAHMLATSDIPDWCFFEAVGRDYNPLAMPTAEEYAHMFRCSPVAHVQAVQTPLLMLLGGADRRVPMSQALDYVKLLKSRGVRTRTLLYPEGQHSIAETAGMEGDVWVSMLMWALRTSSKLFSLCFFYFSFCVHARNVSYFFFNLHTNLLRYSKLQEKRVQTQHHRVYALKCVKSCFLTKELERNENYDTNRHRS
jgi:acetyl esterase/lipase